MTAQDRTESTSLTAVNIPGLSYIPDYLRPDEEARLVGIIDQQPWLQGYLPILNICLTKVYGFSGLHIDTGGGFADKNNINFLAPLAEKEVR